MVQLYYTNNKHYNLYKANENNYMHYQMITENVITTRTTESHIPATNLPAINIHGEMPIKYIKPPPICGKLAARSTSFVLREVSDHLKQLINSATAKFI